MASQFEKAQQKALKALALSDTETADELIGTPPPEEYNALVQGMDGAFQMMWIMAASNGMRTKPAVKKMGGQAQLTMMTLVHYAYALGLKRGRGGE